MKPEIKAKWIKALTSGKYKQGKSSLKTEDGRFCCLGVLCDLHAKATGHKWQQLKCGDSRYAGAWEFLPPSVRKWAGLETDNGELPESISNHESLATANDDGVKFPGIAKLIEKHF